MEPDGASAAGSSVAALHLIARVTELRCGYCTSEIGHARPHACACGATFHRDCWAGLERCGTLGCGIRPTPAERARAGRCPACHGDQARAFRWELAACGRCGALYHLACRARLRRCASKGCRSGRHDAWSPPRPPPSAGAAMTAAVSAAVVPVFPTFAALARRAAGLVDALRPAARPASAPRPTFVPHALRREPYRL